MLYNLFENRDFVSVFAVALLAEGVDRNSFALLHASTVKLVALLAEGVDRNQTLLLLLVFGERVALLAEGVDRNILSLADGVQYLARRPPRRGRG